MAEKIWEGELVENRVIVWDTDSVALYDESGYGKPLPEETPDRVELDLVEAAYLVEKEKMKLFAKDGGKKRKVDFQEIIEFGAKNIGEFHSQFIVFRDLREKGYLVKTGYKFGAVFRVYERGVSSPVYAGAG